MPEMKFIEGADLDESRVTFEHGDVIEYEVSEFISLLYDKNTKLYYLYYIDYDNTWDEFTIELNDDFNGMELDGIIISKEEFDDFKNLIKNVA